MYGNIIERIRRAFGEQNQLKYLPISVKLEESVNPHLVRATMMVISAAVVIFLIWANFARINEIAVARGEVIPRGHMQVVQHLDGGIVTEILVNEGDKVKEGQVLIRVDDGHTFRDLSDASSQSVSLRLQIERLSAFVEGRAPEFKKIANANNQQIALQNDMYRGMISAREKEQHVVEEQLAQKKDYLKKLKQRFTTTNKQYQLAKEAVSIQEKLLKKGYASKLAFIKYKQDAYALQAELEDTQESVTEAQNAIEEYDNRLLSLAAKHKEDAYQLLETIRRTEIQNQELIAKLKDRLERLSIKAPVTGLVKGLAINTIGGVIEPGRTLMELVPLDSKLVVQAKVSPKEVGHLQLGQDIRVKITTFDFSRYGTVDGTLDFISATTFLDEKQTPYYRVRIGLKQTYVGKDPAQNKILPGMTVVGDIVTGNKTLLAYLFKPIHRSLKTAFSER